MKITWLGHACFALEDQGYRIVTDPYINVNGLPSLETDAQQVFCSHDHFDHNAVPCVRVEEKTPSPFTVQEVESFHDSQKGALRGTNMIRIFEAGGVRVAHLGDLGHQLSEEQLAQLGRVDVLLIPVGGTFTLDAAEAKRACDSIRPKTVIPMHFRHGNCGFPVLGTAESFAELWQEEQITRMASRSVDTSRLPAGLVLLPWEA